jgi:2-amino-4-hydroxy-6-hydroxymethyldihydropteridine diphosphokinase
LVVTQALISLGSNVGDRRGTLDHAVELLSETSHLRVVEHSAFYATAPVGGPSGQGEFLNGAAIVETKLKSQELLAELQRIEQALGRQRHERWDARTIDLDLLLYGNQRLRTPELTVPHPRMSFRPFVLVPACEIAGDWKHPVLDETLEGLFWQLRKGVNAITFRGGTAEERLGWSKQVQATHPRFTFLFHDPDLPWIRLAFSRTEVGVVRLSICLDETAISGVPRLALPECDPAHFAAEIAAAIECVWPTGG